MATNTGGWLYETNGTPVDKATADNAQARVLEIKQDATRASADSAKALSTANTYAGEIARANTTAGSAVAIAQANEDTVERYSDDVEGLKVNAGWNAGSPNDAQNAAFLRDPASESHAVLNEQMAKKPLPAGDQTAALQAFLSDGGVLGVRQVIGEFTLAGTVTVPAGVYVDLSKAKMTQTTPDAPALSLGEGVTVVGGHAVGLGTDYAPDTGSGTLIDSAAIKVNGDNVTVMDFRAENFARAGIYNPGFDNCRIIRPHVRGVHGDAATIPAGDSGCFGIYMNSGAGCSVEDAVLSHVSVGLIGGKNVTDFRVKGIHAHTIPGQHGIYLQNGTGLDVSGITGYNINFNLLKVQLQAGDSIQSYGTTITNVSGRSCGDSVLSLNSVGTLFSDSSRYNGLAVSNITGHLCSRVAYIGNVRGGTVTGISGVDTVNDVLTVVDSQDVEFSAIASRTSGRSAVYVTTLPGAATQRIGFSNVRSHNAGGANTAGRDNAIHVACANNGIDGRDITLDGVTISSSDGSLAAAVWFTGGHQESFRVRNVAIAPGSTSESFRVVDALRPVGEFTNIDQGGAVPSIFPTGVPIRIGSVGHRTQLASNVVPTAGTWAVGDRVENTNPIAGRPLGWVCTAAGTPGTWRSYGEPPSPPV